MPILTVFFMFQLPFFSSILFLIDFCSNTQVIDQWYSEMPFIYRILGHVLVYIFPAYLEWYVYTVVQTEWILASETAVQLEKNKVGKAMGKAKCGYDTLTRPWKAALNLELERTKRRHAETCALVEGMTKFHETLDHQLKNLFNGSIAGHSAHEIPHVTFQGCSFMHMHIVSSFSYSLSIFSTAIAYG